MEQDNQENISNQFGIPQMVSNQVSKDNTSKFENNIYLQTNQISSQTSSSNQTNKQWSIISIPISETHQMEKQMKIFDVFPGSKYANVNVCGSQSTNSSFNQVQQLPKNEIPISNNNRLSLNINSAIDNNELQISQKFNEIPQYESNSYQQINNPFAQVKFELPQQQHISIQKNQSSNVEIMQVNSSKNNNFQVVNQSFSKPTLPFGKYQNQNSNKNIDCYQKRVSLQQQIKKNNYLVNNKNVKLQNSSVALNRSKSSKRDKQKVLSYQKNNFSQLNSNNERNGSERKQIMRKEICINPAAQQNQNIPKINSLSYILGCQKIVPNKISKNVFQTTNAINLNQSSRIRNISEYLIPHPTRLNTDRPIHLNHRREVNSACFTPSLTTNVSLCKKIICSKQRKSGFTNSKSTCYMNPVLQCLINSPGFFDFFIDSSPLKNFALEFQKICKYFDKEEANKIPYKTDDLKMLLSKENQSDSKPDSKDAIEFLRSFLDLLHEDLNENKEQVPYQPFDVPFNFPIPDLVKKWMDYSETRDRSIVLKFFQGNVSNSFKCNSCDSMSLSCSNQLYFSLEFSQEQLNQPQAVPLISLLQQAFFKSKNIDSFNCGSCEENGPAEKRSYLTYLPNILVLQLSRIRLDYDFYGNQIQNKINKRVLFPIANLDMEFFLTPSMRKQNQTNSYQLYGVVHHSGTIDGGHFTASCKNPIDDSWNRFDDQLCTPLDKKELNSYEQEGSSSSYILFYQRKSIS